MIESSAFFSTLATLLVIRSTLEIENISKPFEKQTDVHIKCQSKNRIRFQNTENQYFLFFVSAKTLLF